MRHIVLGTAGHIDHGKTSLVQALTGIDTDRLAEEKQTPQTSERLQALFAFQADRAREYYRRAFAHLPDTDRYAQRSGIIMAAIYRTLLDEIAEDGYRVLEHRIHLTPLRKLWIAWRTARRERRYHRRGDHP